jgi:hypothetical protein
MGSSGAEASNVYASTPYLAASAYESSVFVYRYG